ncbi:MAG: hypothetical protein H6713_23665 [Myxococcales bacterium]|nr:hypothetical protein [Myxococcales bacterium]
MPGGRWRSARSLELTHSIDIDALIDKLELPTLILRRQGDRTIHPRHSVAPDERIPSARLVLLDGNAHMPWFGDQDAIVEHVPRFLAED